MKKNTIKPRTHENPSHSRSIRLNLEQAQRPKAKAIDSIIEADKWIRQEEMCKDLTDLEHGLNVIDYKEDAQPRYKHVKHGAGKVILGTSVMPKIIVEEEDSAKVLRFINELKHEKGRRKQQKKE